MSILFDPACSNWTRRVIRREVKLLALTDWTIRIELVDEDEIGGDDVQGRMLALPEYLDATMYLLDSLPNDEETVDVVRHELLHAHYQSLVLVLDQAWDKRRKMPKEDASLLLKSNIETLITRQVALIKRLRPTRQLR